MFQEGSTQELKDRLNQVERKCISLRRLVVCCLAVNLVAIIGFKLPVALTAQAAPPASSPEKDEKAKLADKLRQMEISASQAKAAIQQMQWRQHKLNGTTGVQEAREFRIVDGGGRTRAILGLDPTNKVRLLMFDGAGKELLSAPGEARMMPVR